MDFLEDHGTVATPFEVGAVRMDPEVHSVARAFDKTKDLVESDTTMSLKKLFANKDSLLSHKHDVEVDSSIPRALLPGFCKYGRRQFAPPTLLQVRCAVTPTRSHA